MSERKIKLFEEDVTAMQKLVDCVYNKPNDLGTAQLVQSYFNTIFDFKCSERVAYDIIKECNSIDCKSYIEVERITRKHKDINY